MPFLRKEAETQNGIFCLGNVDFNLTNRQPGKTHLATGSVSQCFLIQLQDVVSIRYLSYARKKRSVQLVAVVCFVFFGGEGGPSSWRRSLYIQWPGSNYSAIKHKINNCWHRINQQGQRKLCFMTFCLFSQQIVSLTASGAILCDQKVIDFRKRETATSLRPFQRPLEAEAGLLVIVLASPRVLPIFRTR